eukprot:CAMPEP_0113421076 /NCGR_PEP_ID=MMETSP0013_2-20120614/27682_1 /TAXON_ID=2843 ORGANISM="Skeletonema costatum, Strain 1716" /NCGR_SAMPLE_ID=MMETSP0013_2 /ASSEMBLY_ACC=CAM_ASM_000158 /LENGTH=482 /DNA_ID=CAMNT_0000308625 /DNA_START=215 /DNA_END=1663 /DNA_ORIENTATION=+ /assembly_acc=CAM_ASM_000158
MGGASSKPDAFVGSSNNSNNSKEAPCSCLTPFFCPPQHNSSASTRHAKTKSFGSPLPDTPEKVRRIRDHDNNNNTAAANGYYYNEETKLSAAQSNNNHNNDELRSSKYGGLEKEINGMFSYENQSGVYGGDGVEDTCADIHDGKDAEAKLYSKYDIAEVLGVGSTSTCHRCIELSTNESRACKIIDKNEIDPKYQNALDQFYMEIETLRSMRHPNIIQLFDVYITEDKIYIIMELMSGGELFDYVVKKGTLTEEEAARIVRKVTDALVYMHSKNVIHRDLKPENLLLARNPRSSHDIEVKIIDFGLSKILVDTSVASTFLGTRGYLAPEIIQRRQYTKSVDAWALGVIVFVLLCGCLPFDDDCQNIPSSPDLRAKFTLRFPRWAKDLSKSAKDLLNHLLDIDPRRRYTAEQALDHPWVRGETASRDSLLQSPGRIKPSPGKHGRSSQETKDHVSQMVANRAIANAQLAARSAPRGHVRQGSI